MLDLIINRAVEADSESIKKLCLTSKFWSSKSGVGVATLKHNFDIERLSSAYTKDTLPSRYLRIYAKVEKMWPQTVQEAKEKYGVSNVIG